MTSHDHMKQAFNTVMVVAKDNSKKLMTLGLNREGTKQKYTYQKNSLPIEVER